MKPELASAAERHLLSLWTAVREASDFVRRDDASAVLALDQLSPLLQALATDARRLAGALEARRPGAAPAASVGRSLERPRVLIIDDEPSQLAALAELLSDDLDVTTTTDPARALDLVHELRPDAVVTDLRMPGIDGLALLELLQREARPTPPVLMVSGSLDASCRLAALERGAFDFIAKPVEVPELKARIHRAVRYARELEQQRVLQETDDLTGLPNRRAFKAALERALCDRRTPREALALALIDQDGLKHVNDVYGHAVGDRAIVTVARALERARRASDTAARLGGDEFALLMPGSDLAGAQVVIARVERELWASPLDVGGPEPLRLAVSWGVTTAGWLGHTREALAESLFTEADRALYQMKRTRAGARR